MIAFLKNDLWIQNKLIIICANTLLMDGLVVHFGKSAQCGLTLVCALPISTNKILHVDTVSTNKVKHDFYLGLHVHFTST